MRRFLIILILLAAGECLHAHCLLEPNFYFKILCNPRSVQFIYTGPDIANATWEFGDGAPIVPGFTATHYFSSYGIFPVKIRIRGFDGCIDSSTRLISLQPQFTGSFISNANTTICRGGTVSLNASAPNGLGACWYDASGFNAASPSISVSPANTTTYYYSSIFEGSNLVVNGDFSAGNTGFTNYCILSDPNTGPRQYWVGNNPSAWNSSFPFCQDHTTGSGNMLMVASNNMAQTYVWQQDPFFIAPQTNYVFSFWVQSLLPNNPPSIKLFINDTELKEVFTASSNVCNWQKFYVTWNSGDTDRVRLAIIDNMLSNPGPAFALDDISFSEMTIRQDSVIITVEEPPVLTSSADATICERTSIQLFSSGASSYSWSPSTWLSNASISNPVATPGVPVQYVITGYNIPGCISTDTINIDVRPAPALMVTDDTTICEGESERLLASGAVQYLWTPATGLSAANLPNPIASPLVTTYYHVTGSGANGCSSEDSVLITVSALPDIKPSKSGDIFCTGSSAQLKANGGTQYLWAPIAGLSDANVANPVATPGQTTVYYVTVTNADGCVNTDSIRVFVNLAGTEYAFVPNAFTPNGDGLNDCFGISKRALQAEIDFSVFNRWGTRIFHTNDPLICWDGNFKGVPQPAGVYIYLIRINTGCGDRITKKGWVTIIR